MIPTEDFLKATLQKHLQNPSSTSSNDDDIKLTPKEAQNLRNAFTKPEFRQLLSDYVTEISDPKHKKETDDYLRELERRREIPRDKVVLRPRANGFVVLFPGGTYDDDDDTVVVNVVTTADDTAIAPPTRVSGTATTTISSSGQGGSGEEWRVPLAVGPMRMEEFGGGSRRQDGERRRRLVPVCDCCVHAVAMEHARSVRGFRKLLIGVVRDNVLKRRQWRRGGNKVVAGGDGTGSGNGGGGIARNDDDYEIVERCRYVNGDEPAVMILGKKKGGSGVVAAAGDITTAGGGTVATSSLSSSADEEKTTTTHRGKRNKNTSFRKGFMLRRGSSDAKTEKKKKKTGPTTTTTRATAAASGTDEIVVAGDDKKPITPRYTFTEQKSFDIADNTLKSTTTTFPQRLVYRIELFRVTSAAAEIDLDVTTDRLVLKCHKGRYSLDLKLPYGGLVRGASATATWDAREKILTVTIPVASCRRQLATDAVTTTAAATTPVDDNDGDRRRDDNAKIEKIEDDDDDDGDDNIVADQSVTSSRRTERKDTTQSRVSGSSGTRENFAAEGLIPVDARSAGRTTAGECRRRQQQRRPINDDTTPSSVPSSSLMDSEAVEAADDIQAPQLNAVTAVDGASTTTGGAKGDDDDSTLDKKKAPLSKMGDEPCRRRVREEEERDPHSINSLFHAMCRQKPAVPQSTDGNAGDYDEEEEKEKNMVVISGGMNGTSIGVVSGGSLGDGTIEGDDGGDGQGVSGLFEESFIFSLD